MNLNEWLNAEDAPSQTGEVLAQPEREQGGVIQQWLSSPTPTPAVRDALEQNPDAVAKNRRTARELGVPPQTVEADPAAAEKDARTAEIEKMLADSPITSDFLSRPNVAPVVIDDVESLSAFERIANGFERGFLVHERGKLGVELRRTRSPETRARVEENRARLDALGHSGDGFISFLSEAATIIGQQVAGLQGAQASTAVAAGGVAGAALSGPLAPVGAVVGMGAGFASHAAVDAFEIEAGNHYLDQIEAGMDPDVAAWASIGVGTVNAALEMVGFAVVAKPFVDLGKSMMKQGAKEAMKDPRVLDAARRFSFAYSAGVAGEVTTEVMQEAVNITSEEISKQFNEEDFPAITQEEVNERLTEIALQTFKGMVVLAAPGPGANFVADSARARRAKKNAEAAKQAKANLEGSKSYERAPDVAVEHAAEVMESKAQVKDVFIPVEQLDAFAEAQGVSPDEFYQAVGVEDQIDEARLLGGDVRLSSRQFLGHVLTNEKYEQVEPHVRYGEEEMTFAEAEEFQKSGIQDEIEELGLNEPEGRVSRDTTEAEVLEEPPVQPDGTIRATHFSPVDGLQEVDPEKQFTNGFMRGAERARKGFPEYQPRSYVGIGFGQPGGYVKEGGTGEFAYEVDIPADKLYNFDADPLGFKAQAKEKHPDNPDWATTLAEKSVKEAGFDGYWTKAPDGLVGVLFRQAPVRRDKLTEEAIAKERKDFERKMFPDRFADPESQYQPLPGLPKSQPGPDSNVQAAAELYAETVDFPVTRQPSYVRVDKDRGERIAKAYDEMEHNPSDPAVAEAYQALVDETLAQYQVIKELGLQIEFIPEGMEDPYGGVSSKLIEDIRENNHMWVFPTDSGFGSAEENAFADHPLLQPVDEYIDGRQLLANDLFRIVHDIFGHVKEGFGFGPSGEENAWQAHVRMYSPLAAKAMTAETRGQNSWVNFGPFGEQNRADPKNTRYADQKAGLLPDWAVTEGRDDGDTKQAEAAPSGPTISAQTERTVGFAEEELGLRQFFRTAQEAGLSASDYRKYQLALARAAEAARTRVERNRLKQRLRETQGQWKKEREKVREEVRESVAQRPVYAAFNGIGRERLDRQAIIDMLPDGEGERLLEQLPKQEKGRAIYTPKGERGIDPEAYAHLYDFEGADVMLFAMVDAPAFNDAVEVETDKRMRELHPEMVQETESLQASLEALHNDNQADVLAFELNQLRGAQQQGRVKAKVVKQAAKRRMREYTVEFISPTKFLSAERREARKAAKLLRRNRRPEAMRAKFRQLMNFEMAREAFAVHRKIERQRKYMRKFLRQRKVHRSLPPEYLDAIRSLLADFNLGPRLSDKKRTDLEKLAAQKRAEGTAIEVPERIAREDGTTNYQDLKLREWETLYETVRALEHQGRQENKLLRETEKRERDEIANEIGARIEANLKPRGRVLETRSRAEEIKRYGREVVSTLMNADTILREVDGFEELGVAYDYIKGGFDKAYTEGYHPGQIGYARRQQQEAKRLVQLFKQYTKAERLGFGTPELIPGTTLRLSKNAQLAVLLNSGNAENIEAMTESKMFDEAELRAIHEHATKKDWDFAQSVWDYLDEFWPEVREAVRRRRGFTPEKVEAQEIETAHGTYRGGYYPLRYDNKQSVLQNPESTQDLLESARFGHFVQSQTKHTHTENRIGSGGRRVLLDLFVINSHVDQVIYDLEVGDAITDAYKILHHKRVKDAFAETGHLEKWESLDLWFGDVVTNELRMSNWLENSLRWMRTGFTVSKLAWNFSTMFLQPLGLSQTAVQIGWSNMLRGVGKVISSPQIGDRSIYSFVASQTGFMAQREQSFNKDIIDASRQVKNSLLARATPGDSAEAITATFFYGIQKFQRFVDTATWLGAKDAGMRLFEGDEAKANQYADRMVARSQASGNFGERTALERGTISNKVRQTELVRAFTALASYFMAKSNVAYERTKKTNFRNPADALMWSVDMAMLYVVEAMLVGLIRQQWPSQDDDPDNDTLGDWLLYMAGEGVNSLMAGIPIFREFSSEVQGFRGGGVFSSVVGEVGKSFDQVSQGEIDAALVKSLNNLGGIFLKYPASQINKTGEATAQFLQGEEVSPVEFIMGPHWEK